MIRNRDRPPLRSLGCPIQFTRYQFLISLLLYGFSFFIFTPNFLFSTFALEHPDAVLLSNQEEGSATGGASGGGGTSTADNITNLHNCTKAWLGEYGRENITYVHQYRSAVIDFHLICESYQHATLVDLLQTGGYIFGALVFGQLGDSVGRRISTKIALVGTLISSIASTFIHDWVTLATTRFICGVFLGGFGVVVVVFVSEMLTRPQRLFLRSIFHWIGPARLIYTGIAKGSRNWRTTFRICNIVAGPIAGICVFVMPDSPRWLIQQSKFDATRDAYKKISKVNGLADLTIENAVHSLEQTLTATPEQRQRRKTCMTYGHLMANGELRQQTAVCTYMLFVTACVFVVAEMGIDGFGPQEDELADLTDNPATFTRSLSSNIFNRQIYIGLALTVGKLLLWPAYTFIPGLSRRTLYQSSVVLSLFCLLIMSVLSCRSVNIGIDNSYLLPIIAIIALVFVEYQFDAIILIIIESFPTVIRCIALGFATSVGFIGYMAVPRLWSHLFPIWAPAPFIVVMFLQVVSVMLSFFSLIVSRSPDLPDDMSFRSYVRPDPLVIETESQLL